MYYPIQLPSLLDSSFCEHVDYREWIVPELSDFIICFWSMQPKSDATQIVKDLVLIDGCSEIVVSVVSKNVVFAAPSMTKTAYAETTNTDGHYIGAKLKPGAFTQLTGLDARVIDGQYLRLEQIDTHFSQAQLAGLDFNETSQWLVNYLEQLTTQHQPNAYTRLFDRLATDPSASVEMLYSDFHLSPRQCQRQFKRYYGITPQMVLIIIRFQYCLMLITKGQRLPSHILQLIQFSDQSHFIREIKKYLGLTPAELLKKLASS